MNKTSKPVSPSPMEGRGSYNARSQVQAASASPALPLLEQAAAEVELEGAATPIVIVDYGVSQGRNSLAPMAVAIETLRARVGPQRALSIIHTDLPGNDFTALFQLLTNDSNSYLSRDSATYASAIGRSFFEQILPSGTVTLGWSSWAVQWLSRIPGPIPDQVQVAFSKDTEAQAAYAQQAAEDWRLFLRHRAREMRTSARLVILTMARDDDGDFGYRPLLEAIYASLQELIAQGLIRDEELYPMAIPTVGRTRVEFAEPFAHDGRFEGLSLENLEVFQGEDHLWHDFARTQDHAAFGAQWAAFSRASVFPTLAAQLTGGPDDPRGPEFIRRLEAETAGRLAMAPAPMNIPLAKMVLVKNSDARQ